MLSKKHFVQIAAVINNVRPPHDVIATPEDMRKCIAQDFADMFAFENPRFDRARFLVACGVGE